MAGTSGCIPDHEVNFFGQLCKSTLPPSTFTPSKPKPQDAIHRQINEKPMPQRTALAASEPDPITIAFQKHQHLIRGFSGANAEAYLATVKEVFAEVRRDRMKACVEQAQERQLAEYDAVERRDEDAAECQNKCQNEQQERHPARQEDQHGAQHQQQAQDRRQSLPGHITQTAPSHVMPQEKKDARRLFPSPLKRRDAMRCIMCVLEGDDKGCSRRLK